MKRITLGLLMLLAASTAHANAGLVACTAGMVTSGFCASTAESVLFISQARLDPDGSGPLTCWDEISAALCARGNYQATIADPANPGLSISNPQTCAQFALARLREWLRSAVNDYRSDADAAAKPARVPPAPEPGGAN